MGRLFCWFSPQNRLKSLRPVLSKSSFNPSISWACYRLKSLGSFNSNLFFLFYVSEIVFCLKTNNSLNL
jgi:hypothetical protein